MFDKLGQKWYNFTMRIICVVNYSFPYECGDDPQVTTALIQSEALRPITFEGFPFSAPAYAGNYATEASMGLSEAKTHVPWKAHRLREIAGL